MAQALVVRGRDDAVLRQLAQPVVAVASDRIQTLIDDLIDTVKTANGVGIAAPQIGQGDRLFIVASRPNPRYPHAPTMEPTAMLNPRIIAHGDTMVPDWEGCLSVPGVRGWVPRYPSITVEYMGRDGMWHQQTLVDFIARIFQHELDHLNGILFPDRVATAADLISEDEYQALIQQAVPPQEL